MICMCTYVFLLHQKSFNMILVINLSFSCYNDKKLTSWILTQLKKREKWNPNLTLWPKQHNSTAGAAASCVEVWQRQEGVRRVLAVEPD
jgi:hypothetical protein